MKRFILFFSLLILALPAFPSPESDEDKMEADTIKVPFFNGLSVHVDLVSPITHLISHDKGHYEVGTRINLKDMFFPAAEVGLSIASKPFFRIGCDYNILRQKHDRYKLFAGARYGFGKFDYSSPSVVPDHYRHWVELVFGTDMKIAGPFHMGWDARWRKGGFFLLYYLNFTI